VLGYGVHWAVLKALHLAVSQPSPTAGAAFLFGYVRAAVTSVPRVEDEEYRRFMRRDQSRRMLRALRCVSPRRAQPARTAGGS
jgi:hypothetical protein